MKENFEEQPLVILHGGFAVKFCPCDPDQVKYSLDTGYFLLPGIVVNGYHIDETTDKYYIECFLFIPVLKPCISYLTENSLAQEKHPMMIPL